MELKELLKRGSGNAVSSDAIKQFYRLNDRDMRRLVEKERRAGAPILSKKGDGGGYFLPETKEEKDHYITWKIKEIAKSVETLIAINTEEKTPLNSGIIPQLEAIIKAN